MEIRTTWTPNDFFQVEDYNRIRHDFAICYTYVEVIDADYSYVPTADDIGLIRTWFQVIASHYDVAIPAGEIIPIIDLFGFNPDDYPTADGKFPPIGTIYNHIGRNIYFPDAAELNLYERLCEYIDELFLGGITDG